MKKACSKCGKTKPISEFYWLANRERHRGQCNSCVRAFQKAYSRRKYAEDPNYYKRSWAHRRSANPGLYQAIMRRASKKWRILNPDRYRAKNRRAAKKWREANPELSIANTRQYRAKYPEKVAATRKKWAGRNRERLRIAEHRRRAQATLVEATLTEDEWHEILAEFGFACAYCGDGGPLEQDHVVPLSRGGPYTRENIVPACQPCNASKSNKLLQEWAGRLQ